MRLGSFGIWDLNKTSGLTWTWGSIRVAILFLPLAFWSVTSPVAADISLPKIFSDHMVLQQKSKVKIWGTAEAGEKLIITFGSNKVAAQADPRGRWSVLIQTGAAGGPYKLEVAAAEGETKVVFTNVMVGEVWLCSGQSNMEWSVTKAANAAAEIESAKDYPNVRLFRVHHHAAAQPQSDFNRVVPWDVCSPESVKDFSAVAFFFARELSKTTDVPIGLIDSSWGGTRCEAWTSRATLEGESELAGLLGHWDEKENGPNQNRPANLFNGMIAPLTGYSFRGAIWYQGEANVGRGHQYATLLPTMIKDWRKVFDQGDFPFYFVQLAPYRYKGQSKEALPEVWDAQFKTLKSVKNVGMVVTTDIGDIKDIHPVNKQEVGRRLALIALANAYVHELPKDKSPPFFSGPVFEAMATMGNKIRLTFRHVGGGLEADGADTLTHFSICGSDRKFVPATAVIEGEAVIVSSPEVDKPVAVRFAWDDVSQPNFFNAEGLPASPFRTDEFELLSKDREF